MYNGFKPRLHATELQYLTKYAPHDTRIFNLRKSKILWKMWLIRLFKKINIPGVAGHPKQKTQIMHIKFQVITTSRVLVFLTQINYSA